MSNNAKIVKSLDITTFSHKVSESVKPIKLTMPNKPVFNDIEIIEPIDIFSSDEEQVLVDFELDSSEGSTDDIIIVQYQPIQALKYNIMNYIFINANRYNFANWRDYYGKSKVNILNLFTNVRWQPFVDTIYQHRYIDNINNELTQMIKDKRQIVPYPQLLFNSFNCVSPNRLKVIIIGQDPYPNYQVINGVKIPDACGSSFSLPLGCNKAKTFVNIIKNLKKYGHLNHDPTTASLSYWILQGVFLFNSTLTTIQTKSNTHTKLWNDFSKDFISYVNQNLTDVLFLVWGRDAYNVCKDIDVKRHHLIISSHPSPLATDKTFSITGRGKNKNIKNTYPPFSNCDHFGLANEWLISKGKTPIFWHIP